MISYKCRSCGGDMKVISKGMGECIFCTGIDSMPTIDSEKFNRAEKLRREQQYFDEAADLYRQIIAENPDEEEAYWGLVLCKFGIEYVRDIDEELKPTCHRTMETSILDDIDYKIACEKADDEKRRHYQKQAKKIQKIQSNILEIVAHQKPYDIFISFKSKDENGNSTIDCNEARKIYYKLKEQNYTVFFSEETLESGKEYEPQIYAALKTAKVMILIGSKEEYLEATWVKNEWKRFKRMIENGENKTIIPICIDLDPYNLPMDLKMYQAINWRDSEAMLKLTESVGELAEKKSDIQAASLDDVYRRYAQEGIKKKIENVKICISNNQLDESNEMLKDIIRDDPSNSEAYWLRLILMVKKKYNVNDILDVPTGIKEETDYKFAVKYASEEQRKEYAYIAGAIEKKCKHKNYLEALLYRSKNFLDNDDEPIRKEISKLEDYKNKINSVNFKGSKVYIILFSMLMLAAIVMFFVANRMFNTTKNSIEKMGLKMEQIPLNVDLDLLSGDNDSITQVLEMFEIKVTACVIMLSAIAFLMYLVKTVIVKNKKDVKYIFIIPIGLFALFVALVSSMEKVISYADIFLIFVILLAALFVGVMPCTIKYIVFVFSLVKRKGNIAQYNDSYSNLCKMLDEKCKKVYADYDVLLEQYNKIEPVDYEIKKDISIHQISETYERIKHLYSSYVL